MVQATEILVEMGLCHLNLSVNTSFRRGAGGHNLKVLTANYCKTLSIYSKFWENPRCCSYLMKKMILASPVPKIQITPFIRYTPPFSQRQREVWGNVICSSSCLVFFSEDSSAVPYSIWFVHGLSGIICCEDGDLWWHRLSKMAVQFWLKASKIIYLSHTLWLIFKKMHMIV